MMPEVRVNPGKDVRIDKEVYDAFGGERFASLLGAIRVLASLDGFRGDIR